MPWPLVGIATTALLVRSGVEPSELLRYAAYWIVAVLGPGMLVHRSLRGRPRSLIEDVVLGAATGLALEIAVGVLLTSVGFEPLVRWWWIAVYGAFWLVPRLRTHWWFGGYVHRETTAQLGATALVTFAAVSGMALNFSSAALPPRDSQVYQDLWWHLSVNQDVLKPGPLQLPQVAGEPLTYHYFAHLHMAIAETASGVPPETVLLRLFPVVMAALAVLTVVVLARRVTGIDWTGPVAAWLAHLAASGGYLWPAMPPSGGGALTYLSPTQLLAYPLAAVAFIFLVDLCRDEVGSAGWLYGALVVFAASGSKPTVLPLMIVGSAAASVVRAIVARRLPWAMVVATVSMLGLWALSQRLAAGSSTDNITFLGFMRGIGLYRELTGDTALLGTSTGWLLDSLSTVQAWAVAIALLAWIIVGNLPRLVGLLGLAYPSVRGDPAAWLLSAALVAAWGAYLLIDHSGLSQAYFLMSAAPLSAVLSVWLLSSVSLDLPMRTRVVVVGLGVGAAVAVLASWIVPRVVGDAADVGAPDRLLVPLATAAGVGAALAAAWWFASRRVRLAPMVGPTIAVAAVIGMAVPGYVQAVATQIERTLAPTPVVVDEESALFVTRAEQEAALWVRDNLPDDAIIATNVHCLRVETTPNCDARSFWLSGLSGRRVLLEGWAYSPEAAAQHGEGGLHGFRQPSPWPDRLAASEEVFSNPSKVAVAELRDEYGVDYLVGVRRAGDVSGGLSRYADKVFDNEAVAVFAVRQ